jgi:hypothetical protein
MSNIFNRIRKFFNHRQHQRYAVNTGTCVVIAHDKSGEKIVKLIDISDGGMAFICRDPLSDLDSSGIMKLFENSSYSAKIQFDTVSEVFAIDKELSPEPFWRRSVKFEWLGSLEKETLKAFINQIKRREKD